MRRSIGTAGVVALIGAALIGAPFESLGRARKERGAPVCIQKAPEFRKAIRLGDGYGYEPGIEIDSKGTIFVTAHKASLTNEGTRTASWIWRSADKGKSFENMAGLAGVTEKMYALEGDLAVDAKDRLYYVDTWAPENHFYRYIDHGKTLDHFRPIVPSIEPVDDRPWLAAHGDGVVYYLSNTGWKPDGRLTIHRSTDGGTTFDPVGYTFEKSGWGFIDADPNSKYVYGLFNDQFYGEGTSPPLLGEETAVFVWVSKDRGQTWNKVKVADYEHGASSWPVIAVSPRDGSLVGVWLDGARNLKLARSTNHGKSWKVYDITPFKGTYIYPWVSVGRSGEIGVIFEADPDDEKIAPGSYVYGMIWRPNAGCVRLKGQRSTMCSGWAASYARLQKESTGPLGSQADFFQLEFSADAAINVPFTHYRAPPSLLLDGEIRFTKQVAGPNLSGDRFCGVVGTP